MMLRLAAVAIGLALGLISGTARAELLHFQYAGSVEFSFDLDSRPTLLFDSTPDDVAVYVSDFESSDISVFRNIFDFFAISIGGGFNAKGSLTAKGEQIFSGDTLHPVFSPGIFNLVEFPFALPGSPPSTLTVSAVSAVPLPSSAPMFGAALIALGAVGYGLKRQGKAAAQA